MCPTPDKTRAYTIRTRCERNRRDRVLTLYGGKCAICGHDNRNHLQLDHINGDGCREREELGSTKQVYTRALAAYRPDRYRILCAHCNIDERIRLGHQGGRHGKFQPNNKEDDELGPLFRASDEIQDLEA